MSVINKDPGIAKWETDTFTEEEFITGDTPAIVTEAFTLLDQNAQLEFGTVLGRITTGGKLTPSVNGASDGSQNAFAILGHVAPDTGADQNVSCYRAGCFNPARLIWDASYNTAAKKAEAFRTAAPMIVQKAIV